MDREKRSTAGNRLSKLLDEEEECQDEFYKVNYGGFEETESDHEYEAEEEGEDIVDSDFSIDENDEPISDNEEEGPKKKKRLVTKAYKEPAPQQIKQKPKVQKEVTPKIKTKLDLSLCENPYERKSIRKSTAAKSAETLARIKVRDLESKRKTKRSRDDEWVPTQEELLEEAKLTEIENLKSLERYQKIENEKKTKRIAKKVHNGPVIEYRSLKMPIIEEMDDTNSSAEVKSEQKEEPKYCERSFLTFLNDPFDVVCNGYFKKKSLKAPRKNLRCAITGQKAKYIDPVTCLPYYNAACFKIIRAAYYQQLESQGDKNNELVSNWLAWYAKKKEKIRKDVGIKGFLQ